MLMSGLRITVGVYAGITLLMALRQRSYIYHPRTMPADDAVSMARAQGFVPWHDKTGELAGWQRKNQDAPAGRRILIFHGNAGSALDRTYYEHGFATAPGSWELIIFEYPGYGPRPGSPSEKSVLQAAETALSSLLAEDQTPVYLIGESLGSGPACHLAGKYPEAVAGLWLVTPFTSLVDVARAHYPFLLVRLMMRDRYDNLGALDGYRGPLFILAAEHDRVVPARLARRLYEEAKTPHKRFLEQSGADHNTLDLSPGSEVWPAVAGYWLDADQAPGGNDN